jgi:hypothetical protein
MHSIEELQSRLVSKLYYILMVFGEQFSLSTTIEGGVYGTWSFFTSCKGIENNVENSRFLHCSCRFQLPCR